MLRLRWDEEKKKMGMKRFLIYKETMKRLRGQSMPLKTVRMKMRMKRMNMRMKRRFNWIRVKQANKKIGPFDV